MSALVTLTQFIVTGVYEARNSSQCHADLHNVGAPEVLLDGVDQQQDELMVLMQHQGDGQISHTLLKQRRLLREFNRVYVAEWSGVTEHFAVNYSDQILFHLFLQS